MTLAQRSRVIHRGIVAGGCVNHVVCSPDQRIPLRTLAESVREGRTPSCSSGWLLRCRSLTLGGAGRRAAK